MKKIKYILFLISFFLLSSCVQEEDIFDEEILDQETVIETSQIFSFLNEEFRLNSVDTESCFTINYPIQIGYNTEQLFTIENFEALEETSNSQSSNLFINSIVLPFSVVNDNNFEFSVNTLEDFNTLFFDCNIPTLLNTLFEKTANCLDFQYPFQMLDVNNELVIIEDFDVFFEFLDTSTSSGPVPKFIFPISLNETNDIQNYFDFYEILNNCSDEEIENCFDIEIVTEELESNTYRFSIESNTQNYSDISWVINDVLLTGEVNTSIEFEFTESNTYEICANAITDNCSEFSVGCTTVEITTEEEGFIVIPGQSIQAQGNDNDICPNLTHTFSQVETTVYSFEALIDQQVNEQFIYFWQVFQNGDFLESFSGQNGVDSGKDFQYVFEEIGTYTICVGIETPECGAGIEYCTDFLVQ